MDDLYKQEGRWYGRVVAAYVMTSIGWLLATCPAATRAITVVGMVVEGVGIAVMLGMVAGFVRVALQLEKELKKGE